LGAQPMALSLTFGVIACLVALGVYSVRRRIFFALKRFNYVLPLSLPAFLTLITFTRVATCYSPIPRRMMSPGPLVSYRTIDH